MSSHASYLRRGALTLGAVTVGGFLADYLFNLGLTHLLSPHGYGDVKVAFAFAHFFGLAVLLGGDRAAPMVLAPSLERGERRHVWEYLRFYMRTALALAAVLIAATWTLSYLHQGSTDPMDHHPLAWVAVAVPLTAIGALVSRTLQSARRPAQAALPWRIGLPVLQLALFGLAAAVWGGLGVVEVVVIGMVAITVVTTAQWLWVRRLELVELARAPDFYQPRGWLAASVPMMGTFLVALALNQSDLYFLEILGDEAEVGHYAAAATAAHLLLLVQTTVIGLVAPIAKSALEGGRETSRATFRHAQRLMLAVAIPLTLLLAGAAGPVLSLFGAEYRVAHTVLVFLACGNLAWAVAAVAALWLQYQGRAGVVLSISIATLIADSALNLLLIPRYGMTGAAASTAATLTAAALATMLALLRRPAASGTA